MKKAYVYLVGILENKKLNMLFWLLFLIYVLWGFSHPEEFTQHKWGEMSITGQYTIVFIMLAIVIFRISQLYLSIKKDKKEK